MPTDIKKYRQTSVHPFLNIKINVSPYNLYLLLSTSQKKSFRNIAMSCEK